MAHVPLNEARAGKALAFFNRLRLPDVSGTPPLSEACGGWFRDILCAFLASEDPQTKQRLVWELLCMIPKKNSKTTYVAALGLTALFMEAGPRRQMLIVAPSQNISDRCFAQAQGMIRLDPQLDAIFKIQDNLKSITRRKTMTRLNVKTFDTTIVTGEIPVLTIIDELHELGKKVRAASVMQQIRGGGITMHGGQVLMITTQSDEQPAGIWKTELKKARDIRDGKGGPAPILLPVLYEFPSHLQKDQEYWRDQRNWPMILPNIGRSIDPARLAADYENNGKVNDHAEKIWVSQHLNIEIGVGLKTDGWPGAEFWVDAEDPALTLEEILIRSEVVVAGVDGGGLDDLFGVCVLGRDRETSEWLCWVHAWCHKVVLERRKSIAPRLLQAQTDGELTIIDHAAEDIEAIVALIDDINKRKLLACVAVDPAGLGELIESLRAIGITQEGEQVVGAPQGYAMMNSIRTAERKTENGSLKHAPNALMDWCIGNLKIEATATAIRATKQNAGDAKIDPAMALFDAVTVMVRDPKPQHEPESRLYFA